CLDHELPRKGLAPAQVSDCKSALPWCKCPQTGSESIPSRCRFPLDSPSLTNMYPDYTSLNYWILLALLSWGMLVVLLAVRSQALLKRLWREPALACPVVIVESDDWGPGPESDARVLKSIAAS